jgi:hypothetical protein
MKFYLDTEFIECAKQRRVLGIKIGPAVPTIDLISIGLVGEDGRELYLLNADCELQYAWDNEWVRDNVLYPIWQQFAPKYMRGHSVNYFGFESISRIFKDKGHSRGMLAWHILTFVHAEAYAHHVGTMDSFFEAKFTDKHAFYGYFSDYDWVVFCQLFGRMIDLPHGFPMFCHDLKQEMVRLSAPDSIKPNNGNEHNALADAKWNKMLHTRLLAQYPSVA